MFNRCLRRLYLVQSVIFTKFVASNSDYSSVTTFKMQGPKTLQQLSYDFNAVGNLCKLDENGKPSEDRFQFNISDKHSECQRNYEEVGEAVTQYIYGILETQEKLHRLPVPVDGKPEESTFIFASEDYDKKDTLLVLIHGAGVVRAGQWARSIIINEGLDQGTQIPYIRKAIENGYGVLITNTNDNFIENDDGVKAIAGSSNPEKHGLYVWENYISKTAAKNILIVAHSYGGVVTLKLAHKEKEEFEKRVKAIAFTDSVHGASNHRISRFLKEVAKNWVTSTDPLDTPVPTPDYDITRVSAGHTKHEMTSYSCMESVFKFFKEKLPSE